MIIPYQSLSKDVLDAIIEEYITREALTDIELNEAVAHIHSQLHSGKIVITYDEESESCNLVAKG